MLPRHFCWRSAPKKAQAKLHLVAQQLQDVNHALLPARGKRVDNRTADEHGSRTERECAQDIHAAAHAAVEQDLRTFADGLRDLRERVDRRPHAVELPPAVVGHDHCRRAVLDREPRVLGRQYPF